MKHVAKLAVALIPLVLLFGCGSKGPAGDSAGDTALSGGADGSALDGGAATPLDAEAQAAAKMKALLEERVIYFDFDRSEIKPEYREIVEAHAKHLAANPNMTVTIEGHCDERGTREYNMALGERRAHSVLRMLTMNGVGSSQIRTVSFGEERPEVEGHDESAWSKNRRAIFAY